MKVKKKITPYLIMLIIAIFSYACYYVYTHFIHYKLHYNGYSTSKEDSTKLGFFESEFSPNKDSVLVQGTYIQLKNALLEKKWKSIGNPENEKNEKYPLESYQLIVSVPLGVIDLIEIPINNPFHKRIGIGDVGWVYTTTKNLKEITFEIEVKKDNNWAETIIIDTVTYSKITTANNGYN